LTSSTIPSKNIATLPSVTYLTGFFTGTFIKIFLLYRLPPLSVGGNTNAFFCRDIGNS
jgi:hypothetical protein